MNVPIYLGCLLMSIFAINKIIAEPMIECDPTVIRSQSTKIPDSEFCNKYFECLGGNLTEKYCSTGYHFSDIEDECVEVSSLVTSGNCATATTTSVALNGTLNATPTPTPNLRQSCKIFGVCSQKCNDTGGIVRCSCIEGFKLEEKDNKTCTLIGKWKLLYLTNSVVGYGGGDRKRTHTIKSENSAVFTGVTFDARKNYACWTDASEFAGGVYCSHFNGSKLETIVNSGIGYPQSVALDWVTSNIYFVDWGRKEILVCRSGINTCSVIVTQHVGSPNDLVLEPNQGLMFWTNQIGNHKIMRADMDGRNLITLLSSDLKAIQGLAIDHSTSTLYWIDTKFDKLESCLLDGKDRRVIISGNRLFFDAFFIDVFGDSVFWTNRNTSKIMSAEKFTGANVKQIFVNQRKGELKGGRILHSANQPLKLRNPCEASGCSHICVISRNSIMKFRCVCPVGMQLDDVDSTTCIETPNFPKLAVAYGSNIYMITLDSIGKALMEAVPIPGAESIYSMVYNIVNNSLVLALSNSKVVEFALDTKTLRNITVWLLDTMIVDVDLVGENLYWIHTDLSSIETQSLRTGATYVLSLRVENVTAFSISPETGSAIVATTGNKENFVHKFSLDGKNIKVIRRLGENIEPIFAIDKHTGRIYWLNETTGAFDSLSSTGDEGIAVVGEDHIPNFAVSEHDTLYYVPRERTVRVAKYQGFKKYSYKLELSDEEIARTGYTGKTIVALVNKTFSHELYHLRRTNECSSVSIRQKNCSHICVVGEGYRGSCRCPLGFKMEADDDTTCVEVKLNVCNEGQFKCSDNSCIKEELLCDGVPDCREGEDEENCKDQMNCPRQTFHCGKNDRPGMCIPIGWFYDNEEDCEDGSDERSCTKYSCKETDHYCEATDRCVPKSWICALRYNCPGIDAYQFCRGYNCNTEQFLCADLSKCISRNWFCDTGRDCPDGSDEPSEYCPEVRRR